VLVLAASFTDLVLAVHILGVVIGFGVTFTYPVFLIVGSKLDPSALPWFHRMQQQVGRRIINPGLTVVLLAGIYLATDEHRWGAFFVQWGVGAVIVIGAIEGSFIIPREGRLAALAERDLAATPVESGGRTVTRAAFSREYDDLFRQTAIFGGLLDAIVVVTVFLMAAHAGA
jgi:hypothetical protein